MKKIILTAAIALMLSASTSAQKNQATVNQYQGYLVFYNATPVTNYIVLGTVQKGSSYPGDMLSTIVKRAKKQYPEGEAVIFDGVDMVHATVIKFTEK